MLAPLLLALALAAEPALAATAAPPPSPPLNGPLHGPLDLAALLARAGELKLAEEAGWLRLGHWRPRWLPGVKGDPDGPGFYLAPGGKTDPAAELAATLAGLLAPSPGGDDELKDPYCRFPARLHYLAGRLGFDPASLPPRACPRQLAFFERIQARSVTVVFSSYYMNNPASSFGHTFLRLNKTEVPLPGKTFELLDYGVDYAATPDTQNALFYAFKGLFGLFKGSFSHYPYYYKVREYADAEQQYRTFLAKAPTHAHAPQARVRRGLALHLAGKQRRRWKRPSARVAHWGVKRRARWYSYRAFAPCCVN